MNVLKQRGRRKKLDIENKVCKVGEVRKISPTNQCRRNLLGVGGYSYERYGMMNGMMNGREEDYLFGLVRKCLLCSIFTF